MTTISYKSWPFKEAQKLQKRFKAPPAQPVKFETGFGPSGLPHIGTFAEVARTTWVRHAFEQLTHWPTQLIAFSDDMDGLRKVPGNMPNPEMLAEHLGKPLCHIPDPFGQCESYSAYMNQKLQEFLDAYNFEYTFQSSYEAYTRGDFNAGLSLLLQHVEEVKAIILPTMSEEKQQDWSPFFPICEQCGRIYSTRVVGYHPENDTIDYSCDRQEGLVQCCGHQGTTSIHNGHVKVGWKVDWALRWYSYDISYEMYGKDLIESAKLSGKIERLMGKQPPNGFFYELFLDEEGRKISKSVGKGLTIDTWVNYASLESLLYYLFQNPKQAKRLFWGIVPKSVDDYLAALRDYPEREAAKQPDSPIWHIFSKGVDVPEYNTSINFSLINNLISAVGTDDPELVLEYLKRYDPSAEHYPEILNDLITKGMNYYRDFILPNKHYRPPTEKERRMLQAIHERLAQYDGDHEDELQSIPFDVARQFEIPPRNLFKMFYEVVLGQERGPRFGTFTRLVGRDRVLALLDEAVQNQ
ncbi:lysine--tRNA ligase [candidate division KSB3 bacterium]|uniref:Lysine--tRNA ligase n=1 Tax=candidate division KSB3 bacterium TaxID=2044937 RepID=A0A9D5K0D5_9BACT|nr:lysine--tRNA ligase [candidate division KSB3 bacterium]MBD3327071.1 lysine--tRNA ligase [candidate division KSB3 bacterium]